MVDRAYLERMSRDLANKGQLIGAGWVGYRLMVVPSNAPPIQIDECRLAFYAGAQHLFASLMAMLDPETEPTDDDANKMDLIDKELRTFAKEFELRIRKPQGSS